MQARPSTVIPTAGVRATRACVDLDAIAANVRYFRSLAPTAELIAVVKGDGYGHGSVQVADTALRSGAGRLAVYTVDEGLCLRAAGIAAPILLFGPIEPDEASKVVSARLSPTLTSMTAVELLEKAAGAAIVETHIKVDTGMTRAGALPREAIDIAREVVRRPRLRLASVYTHFACADELQGTTTEDQLGVLLATVEQIESRGIPIPLVHASNTAGALNYPAARLGAMRVGIGLYGYDPSRLPQRASALRPALTLTSRLTRVTSISSGVGVGYGHEFVAATDSVIGLVPIGYGDGLPRQLGKGRGQVLVRGRRAPIVGRVSMDQVTVDLTGIPGAAAGDEVILIGESGATRQTADHLGDQAGTISYDILTGLLPRIPRIYVQDAQTVGISRMGRFSTSASSDQ